MLNRLKINIKKKLGLTLSPEETAEYNEQRIGLNNNFLKNTADWGLQYAVLVMLRKIYRRLGKEELVLARYHEFIENFLRKYGSEIILNYQNVTKVKKMSRIPKDSIIWICWWQGEEKAPPLVKACIESVRKNSKDHMVQIVTEKNFRTFAEIPPVIIAKWRKGLIGHANFADILRCALLSEHGGIWLDATMYMCSSFPDELYGRCFCSYKRAEAGEAVKYVACGRWGSYYLAAGEKNPLMMFARDMQYVYWMNNDKAIDYGLIDYCIDLACREIPLCREALNACPADNPDMHHLYPIINDAFSAELYEQMCKGTYLFKLSYKKTFLTCVGGVDTFYQKLIMEQGNQHA